MYGIHTFLIGLQRALSGSDEIIVIHDLLSLPPQSVFIQLDRSHLKIPDHSTTEALLRRHWAIG